MRQFVGIGVLFLALLAPAGAQENHQDLVEMTLHSVSLDPRSNQPVILLADASERFLPIWVEFTQARSIFMGLRGLEAPRPMTHDLILSILSSTEATIERIEVSDLRENTFYANISLRVNGEGHIIDSRPSDAIALAIRLDAPIFVAEAILRQASDRQETALPGNIDVVRAYGISVQELTPTLSQVLGLQVPHGVLVSNVERESEAFRNGVRRGDVVLEVNGTELHHPDDFRRAFKQDQAFFTLQVARSNDRIQVKLKGKAQEHP